MSTTPYVPYTYLLRFKPTGQLYYGASYTASKHKMAHPSRFWVTYFTSSNTIKSLIAEFGKDAFEFEIRKTFSSPEKTIKWEDRILKKFNVGRDPKWLNKSSGNGRGFVCLSTSEETKKKQSIAAKARVRLPLSQATKDKIAASLSGRKRPAFSEEARKNMSKGQRSKKLTEEHKRKISEAHTGKTKSAEHKKRLSEANKGKTLSAETRAKMSAAHAKRKLASLK